MHQTVIKSEKKQPTKYRVRIPYKNDLTTCKLERIKKTTQGNSLQN